MQVQTNQQLNHESSHLQNRLLRFPAVQDRVGLCRSQIYSLIAQHRFPPPIKIGVRASAWSEIEVSQWIDERISESRQ
jgi:prophage regulatory protein